MARLFNLIKDLQSSREVPLYPRRPYRMVRIILIIVNFSCHKRMFLNNICCLLPKVQGSRTEFGLMFCATSSKSAML